jgi:Spirocyclase AveC-like
MSSRLDHPHRITANSTNITQGLNGSLVWIIIGIIMLSMSVYCFGSWINSSDFVTNTFGREDVPGWLRIWIRTIEVLSVSLFVYCYYTYLYRPWRQNGEISFDGLIVLACASIFWQDVAANYAVNFAQLNTYFTNFGSWYGYIPGWQMPNIERMPEAIVAWGASYSSWFVLLPVLAGNKAMQMAKTRWPDVSTGGLVLVALLFFIVLDFVLEVGLVQTHAYTYMGAIKEWSLWPEQVERFPLYEPLLWGASWTAMTCLYYFRDDRGYSFADRGVTKLTSNNKAQKFLRFLALAGVLNVIFMAYNIVMVFLSLNGGSWPANPPRYLSAGLCGPTTAYACPDSALPIARRSAPTNRIIPIDSQK